MAPSKKSIAIIGGGPAALMLAARIDTSKYTVTIYEKNFAIGRKFLVAGEGGFNLTHSEDLNDFINRYSPQEFMEPCLRAFSNIDLIKWLDTIGIPTFIGSSKRVFPQNGIKPIEVLNAILDILRKKNVQIKTRHHWLGWNSAGQLMFQHNEVEIKAKADFTVFALGGSSWSKTGSDGKWLDLFSEKEIKTLPFQASNCAIKIDWGHELSEIVEGKALKNIVLSCGEKSKLGEVVITSFGLEGGVVYALIPEIRSQINNNGNATLFLDFKPTYSKDEILSLLLAKGNKSYTSVLKNKLSLGEIQFALLRSALFKKEFTSPHILSERIKAFPISISSLAPIDEAISSIGGISLDEVNNNFQFIKMPNHFAIGEMLDWDAPTGGYLLQGCFSMGYFLGEILNRYEEK